MSNPEFRHENLDQIKRLAIEVRGIVQGVGFRPFVYNLAQSCGLTGWVRNEGDLVRIQVQGREDALDQFCQRLHSEMPAQARIDKLDISHIPVLIDETDFRISTSTKTAQPRPTIPADLATCKDCLEEIRNPAERRYRYPFTNCTNCGPRWSIILELPYDRPNTSMSKFAMCDRCRQEYENPADRRFHAQPIACPECGPKVWLVDSSGNLLADGHAAIQEVAKAILAGKIVALKGLGGFQLLVDATQPAAVQRLRERKRRPHKPFALMMSQLAEAGQHCQLDKTAAEALISPQAPIVLLPRRKVSGVAPVAEAVAPENPFLGVMLPYTPLHYLLMEAVGRPIVCTSGNLSEEPMAIDNSEALQRLGHIAELFLMHDRPIVRPVDDSVVRVVDGVVQSLRRARGYAPRPIKLKRQGPTILAVGGHLKNTVALALEDQVIVSSHIGDLDNTLSVALHRCTAEDLLRFFNAKPDIVACDMHPDYASTQFAEELAGRYSSALVPVQHHHAHIASCIAEHGLEGPVIGVAWDGTGYGTDGTIWGGEILLCQADQMKRLATLRSFPLPGGDKAVHEPRRSALGILYEILGAESFELAGRWFSQGELKLLKQMLDRKINCPQTTSMGRLFDAVAAICGLERAVSFEGQAAMHLEFIADTSISTTYPWRVIEGNPAVMDWEATIRAILADVKKGIPASVVSARFHNTLIEILVSVVRQQTVRQVVLSGGCFQNLLLTQRATQRLRELGYEVYINQDVPPNDGGISLGQVLVAQLSYTAARCQC